MEFELSDDDDDGLYALPDAGDAPSALATCCGPEPRPDICFLCHVDSSFYLSINTYSILAS